MRGLPRVPDQVVHVVAEVDVGPSLASFGFWLFIPDVDAGGLDYLRELAASFIFAVSPALLNCMHNEAHFVACRMESGGPNGAVFVEPFPPNLGAWTGGQLEAGASGIYVQSLSPRKGSGSRLRVPALPDAFVTDNVALSAIGFEALLHACNAFTAWIAANLSPGGEPIVLGTLQRARGGVPLAMAEFDPAGAIRPSRRIDVIRRRMPSRGRVAPL